MRMHSPKVRFSRPLLIPLRFSLMCFAGPGMYGCLSCGSHAANAMASMMDKPIVGVHHMVCLPPLSSPLFRHTNLSSVGREASARLDTAPHRTDASGIPVLEFVG